jgi:hypothetical protein
MVFDPLRWMGTNALPFLPKLVLLLTDPEPKVRTAAEQRLLNMGIQNWPEDATVRSQAPEVIRLLKHSNSSVRLAAVSLLTRLQPQVTEALPQYLLMLQSDTNAPCRAEVLRAIRSLDLPPATVSNTTPYLVAALADEDPAARLEAKQGLTRLNPNWRDHGSGSQAVSRLLPVLLHRSPEARAAAAEVLGSLGRTALPAMPRLLLTHLDADSKVRTNAKQAFARIDPRWRLSQEFLAELDRSEGLVTTRGLAQGASSEVAQPDEAILKRYGMNPTLMRRYGLTPPPSPSKSRPRPNPSSSGSASQEMAQRSPDYRSNPYSSPVVLAEMLQLLIHDDAIVRAAANTALRDMNPQWASTLEARKFRSQLANYAKDQRNPDFRARAAAALEYYP